MIRYSCPNCGEALAVDDSRAGRVFVCGLCGRDTTVPADILHEKRLTTLRALQATRHLTADELAECAGHLQALGHDDAAKKAQEASRRQRDRERRVEAETRFAALRALQTTRTLTADELVEFAGHMRVLGHEEPAQKVEAAARVQRDREKVLAGQDTGLGECPQCGLRNIVVTKTFREQFNGPNEAEVSALHTLGGQYGTYLALGSVALTALANAGAPTTRELECVICRHKWQVQSQSTP